MTNGNRYVYTTLDGGHMHARHVVGFDEPEVAIWQGDDPERIPHDFWVCVEDTPLNRYQIEDIVAELRRAQEDQE